MSNKASRPVEVSAGPIQYSDYGIDLTYTVTVPVAVTVVKRLTQGGSEVRVQDVRIGLGPARATEAADNILQAPAWGLDDAVPEAACEHVEALLDGGGQLTLWED